MTHTEPVNESGEITDLDLIVAFIFGGHAIFTIVSRKTGTRFTYRVTQGDPRGNRPAPFFVGLLAGPNNTRDYTYLGCVFDDRRDRLNLTKASRAGDEAPSVKAFRWLLKCVEAGNTSSITFYHEGHCARCGRLLTVPESRATGFGPVCITKVAA